MNKGLRILMNAAVALVALAAYGQGSDLASLKRQIDTPVLTKRAVSPVQKYMASLCASLKEHYSEVRMQRDDQVVVVTLPCSDLFAPNQTEILKSGEKYLRPFNSLLKYPTMYKLLVTVYADNTGDVQYREALTEDRALAIIEFWKKDSGMDASSAMPFGIATEGEVAPNNSISNRAKNRRVEIYIVPNDDMVKTAAAGKLK